MLRAAIIALATLLAAPVLAQTVTVPVPLATIYPGDPISAAVIGERSVLQSQVRSGFVQSPAELTGKIARRTLLPNHPIALSALGNVSIVSRGAPVRLVFEQGGLIITAYAAPLENGSAGDLIRVRNADTGTVVTGVVQADGSVRVGLP